MLIITTHHLPFSQILNKGFEACGTVRKDRKGPSETFKSTCLAKGIIKTITLPLYR